VGFAAVAGGGAGTLGATLAGAGAGDDGAGAGMTQPRKKAETSGAAATNLVEGLTASSYSVRHGRRGASGSDPEGPKTQSRNEVDCAQPEVAPWTDAAPLRS
jgi:hypothetical protein